MSKCLVHLNALNDRNGNPRRLFVVYDRGIMTHVYVEGYNGTGVLPPALRKLVPAGYIMITPKEYRTLKKRADETRRMMSGGSARARYTRAGARRRAKRR